MNDRANKQLDKLLDRATEALRGVQPAYDPPPELVNITIGRMNSLVDRMSVSTEPAELERFTRRARLPRVVGYSAVAAALVLFAVSAVWLILFDRTAAPTFAQVIQQVANAKSVTFISESTSRNDITKEISYTEHVKWYVEGQRLRMEHVAGGTAIIADLQQQQNSALDLKRKTAYTDPLDDEITEMIANPIGQILQLKAENARLVGEEVLNGRKMQLYELDKVDFLMMGGKGATKIWVDPQTQLPVKIAIEPKKRKGRSDYTAITNFEWNKALDESLFRIPKDYTMMDANQWMKERRKGKPERN